MITQAVFFVRDPQTKHWQAFRMIDLKISRQSATMMNGKGYQAFAYPADDPRTECVAKSLGIENYRDWCNLEERRT